MKNRFLLAIITSLMVFLQTNAFRLLNSFTDDITPERSIVRDDTGITVSYTFHGGVILHDELYQGRVRLDIPMFGNNGTLEEPAYPLRNDSFEIPDGYDATLSVISADWCNLEISLSPCRPLLVDRSDEVYSFDNVPPVKDFIGTLPKSPVASSLTQPNL